MPQLTRMDRARGCLLGLAIGDALGAPLEGLSSQQIRAHYGLVDDYVDGARAWKKKPYRWRMPGLYSDDTQQAMALSDVLLECRRIDLDRLAELYLGMATPKGSYVGAHRGIGRSFRQVLAELERGVSPRETGQASAGIGAAMRIAPVALYFHGQPDEMFEAVIAASLMTHRRHPQPGRGGGRRARRPPPGGRGVARAQLPVPAGGRRRTRRGPDRRASTPTWSSRSARTATACPAPSPTSSRCSTCPATRRWPPWSRRPTATGPTRSASAPRWASPPPASRPACTC